MKTSIQLLSSQICFALVAVLSFGALQDASAVTKYWRGCATSGSSCEQSGNWDMTTKNWRGGTGTGQAPDTFKDTLNEDCIFGINTAGSSTITVTVNTATMSPRMILFKDVLDNKYVIAASGVGSIALDATPIAPETAILFEANDNLSEISAPIVSGTPNRPVKKTALGTLVLSGVNTYSAGTTISAGRLNANTASPNSSTGSGAVTVSAGGTLGGNGRIGGAVTVANDATAVLYPKSGAPLILGGNLTFSGSSSKIIFDLSTSAASGNDQVVLEHKTLARGGAQITINLLGATLDTTTDYVLFDVGASGSLTGTAFQTAPAWAGTVPANPERYSIGLDGTGKKVVLHYTAGAAPQTLHWGLNNANWTDANVWVVAGTGSSATYNDAAPDSVVLEDTHSGSGGNEITLSSTVSPGSVTMTASKNFTITGAGKISGNIGLTKGGAGTLTLNTQNDDYTGVTTVNEGTLSINSIGNIGGGASAIGNPASGNGTIKLGSGATAGSMQYTGSGHSSDRAIDVATTDYSLVTMIDASGGGALVLGGIINNSIASVGGAENKDKGLYLGGTSTAENKITGNITDLADANRSRLNVFKRGSGTWKLEGNKTYRGVTDIEEGILVIDTLANGGTSCSLGAPNGNAQKIIGLGKSTTAALVGYLEVYRDRQQQ